MKIEKINDHQIRCILTKDDLADRQIKISELAYGTDKATSLFKDMMQQASFEFGFEAEDIPVMIEAIPLSSDSIVLNITKVEDPEELDTRFSKFAPSIHEELLEEIDEMIESGAEDATHGADDVIDLFKKLSKVRKEAAQAMADATKAPVKPSKETSLPVKETSDRELTRIYSFAKITDIMHLADVLNSVYTGKNDLYKNPTLSKFYLVITRGEHTPEEYNKICNMMSEYGTAEKYSPTTEAFFKEHCRCIIANQAIQSLQMG